MEFMQLIGEAISRRRHSDASIRCSSRSRSRAPRPIAIRTTIPPTIPDKKKAKAIGRKIAEKRQSESLSQVALAEEAGISQVALSRIETGHAQPRPTTLRRIGAALGISARELLAGL